MMSGRIVGDWVTGRLGPVRTLQAGALLTGVSLGAALLIGMPVAALVGLFAVGLGVANGVPLMFSAAGRQPDTAAGPAIAAVASMGSFGFLIGPPIIGVLADAVSLPWALTTLIGAAAVVFALARRAAGPKEQTFDAVISDLDGVLIDSTAPTVRSWRAWGERHGLDGEAIQAGNHGRPARAVIAEHVGATLVEEEAALLAHAETTDTEGVVAYPGAGDVLALPRVAIATSCTAPLARARLAAAGLPEPEVLVTSDQVENGKPAPDPYLLAAERLGVDPAACVVLEDAPAGIESGRAAGMTVWAVTTTHEPDALGRAQRVAGGLREHLAALKISR